MRREVVAALGALLLGGTLLWAHGAKPWPVPQAAKKRKNPVPATKDSVKLGAELYQGNCLLCHGEKGDGQGPWVEKLRVKPAAFADRHMMSEMTDGEIFWKISRGRDEMPRFELQLNARQRWHLVNYLRSLAQDSSKTSAGER